MKPLKGKPMGVVSRTDDVLSRSVLKAVVSQRKREAACLEAGSGALHCLGTLSALGGQEKVVIG